jgi:tRNA(Ile)-lysidine synthase
VTPAERVEASIREHGLIEPGGAVTCLVSGGADSTCLWHVLRALGYGVSALHVDHGLRGRDSDDDARFCREVLGADIVDGRAADSEASEAVLRTLRYSYAIDRLRATGHTASDQVETLIYRLASSGTPGAIKPKREDGVVRPLLEIWRDETEAYCRAQGLPFRIDRSNGGTKRGLIRDEIVPLLRRLHPAADRTLLRAAEEAGKRPLPKKAEKALLSLLAAGGGSKRIDLGSGLQAVREYDTLWVERGPVELAGAIRWGDWTIEADVPGLSVRGWRAGDRLAGRSKKLQDVFVDAKVPRSLRESWPLVVRGDEVVAVPGIVETPGVRAWRGQ